jgi:hypothetical protein
MRHLSSKEGDMMHQRIEPEVTLDDRPDRDMIIEKDEIIGLIIDLETLSPEELDRVYFSMDEKDR